MITFLQIIHLLISIALIGIVLMQGGKGQGLSGAFGSFAGNTVQNMFGARTTDALTRITAYLSVAFIVLAIILALLQGQKSETSVMKNYSTTNKTISTTPSESVENIADKISEMTDKLLQKTEIAEEEYTGSEIESTDTDINVPVTSEKTEVTDVESSGQKSTVATESSMESSKQEIAHEDSSIAEISEKSIDPKDASQK